MLTSDHVVDDGARCELVVTSPGEEALSFHVSSETPAKVLRAWNELERQEGARITANDLFGRMERALLCRRERGAQELVIAGAAPTTEQP